MGTETWFEPVTQLAEADRLGVHTQIDGPICKLDDGCRARGAVGRQCPFDVCALDGIEAATFVIEAAPRYMSTVALNAAFEERTRVPERAGICTISSTMMAL
ncbi:hypothetical protein BN2475_180015 [Paraburkholderia ribeironis]|uniref:Uncharacterized protein n=1 Tax=Paraburkholderia ribeironis TaxID=1247936 RepID=A0A1N7RUV1_9BURK|nr:hypothetical protein BN2475_180015 [Paraburkholderia ribeironis]